MMLNIKYSKGGKICRAVSLDLEAPLILPVRVTTFVAMWVDTHKQQASEGKQAYLVLYFV